MQDATSPTNPQRKLALRVLGGEDRSRPTDESDNTFFDLLNLRPGRGSLIQTTLVGPLIDEIVES